MKKNLIKSLLIIIATVIFLLQFFHDFEQSDSEISEPESIMIEKGL